MVRGHLERLRLKKAMVLLAFLVMLYICGPQFELVIDGKAQVLCFRCDLQNLARDGLIIRPLLVMRIKSLRLPCL